MEDTFNTRVIILNRRDFREYDSLITVYSREEGKLDLIVRGGKRIKSKLSSHCEPLTLSRLMIIRGREMNYVGSSVGDIFYSSIKNDLNKMLLANEMVGLVNRATREGEVDGQREVFALLEEYLNNLNKSDIEKKEDIFNIFSKKLADILGFSWDDFRELSRK